MKTRVTFLMLVGCFWLNGCKLLPQVELRKIDVPEQQCEDFYAAFAYEFPDEIQFRHRLTRNGKDVLSSGVIQPIDGGGCYIAGYMSAGMTLYVAKSAGGLVDVIKNMMGISDDRLKRLVLTDLLFLVDFPAAKCGKMYSRLEDDSQWGSIFNWDGEAEGYFVLGNQKRYFAVVTKGKLICQYEFLGYDTKYPGVIVVRNHKYDYKSEIRILN